MVRMWFWVPTFVAESRLTKPTPPCTAFTMAVCHAAEGLSPLCPAMMS